MYARIDHANLLSPAATSPSQSHSGTSASCALLPDRSHCLIRTTPLLVTPPPCCA